MPAPMASPTAPPSRQPRNTERRSPPVGTTSLSFHIVSGAPREPGSARPGEHAGAREGARRHRGAGHRPADGDDLLGALVAEVLPGRRSHVVGVFLHAA